MGDLWHGNIQTALHVQLAFMHFRFEEESGEPVLYLYEIQIAQQAQVGTAANVSTFSQHYATASSLRN